MTKCKICPISFGLALGIVWGASMLGMGLLMLVFMNGKPVVAAVGQFYLGYNPTFFSSAIGGLIGFVGASIGGAVIAWLYNMFNELSVKLGITKCN